jgi:hypothetical protein
MQTTSAPPAPPAPATGQPSQEVGDLRLILLDCRNADDLAAIRAVYSDDLIQEAWGLLSREERRQIHRVQAQLETASHLSIRLQSFGVGDIVASNSELDPPQTIGTVTDIWESEGKTFVTVQQENGILSAATAAWWAARTCYTLATKCGTSAKTPLCSK